MPVQWEYLEANWGKWRPFERDWAIYAESAFVTGQIESIESLPDPNDESVKWQIVFTRVAVNVTDSLSHHIQQRLTKIDDNWVHVMGSDRFVRRRYTNDDITETIYPTDTMAVDTINS